MLRVFVSPSLSTYSYHFLCHSSDPRHDTASATDNDALSIAADADSNTKNSLQLDQLLANLDDLEEDEDFDDEVWMAASGGMKYCVYVHDA